VIRINPCYTTQKCSKCGELVQKSLSVRTHICPSCGYVADRDVNAARNIFQAGAPPSGTLAVGLADERGALWAKPPALAARSCHSTK
jgi:putative transposase